MPSTHSYVKGTGVLKSRPKTASAVLDQTDCSKNIIENVPRYKDDVVIHVFDEGRNAKRDFHCRRDILLREMSYFEKLLDDSKSTIEVHADVEIFEQLMGYCFSKDIDIDCQVCVSILISAHFLGMDGLEDKCLDYFHSHANEILKIPIDFNCLHGRLLKSLSARFSPLDIFKIDDPKDKLKSSLYKEKIGNEMLDLELFSACSCCNELFRLDRIEQCAYQNPKIDGQGNLLRSHVKSIDFILEDWIASVYISSDFNWERTYWVFWATSTNLSCRICNQEFALIQIDACCQHPKPSTVSANGL